MLHLEPLARPVLSAVSSSSRSTHLCNRWSISSRPSVGAVHQQLARPVHVSALRQISAGAGPVRAKRRPWHLTAAASSGTPAPRDKNEDNSQPSSSSQGEPERSAQPPSTSEASTSSSFPATDPPSTGARVQNTQWAHLLLELPLELAAVGARTNERWLRKRKRSHWWSKGPFPKVPASELSDIEKDLPDPWQLWRKLLALGLIFFCASFNLTILQNLKDSIVVTSMGAETLPFLSAFGVLPASLAFFVVYNKLVAKLPPKLVFAAAVTPLAAFYVLFASVIYPAADVLHPYGATTWLAAHLPAGLHGLLRMYEHWTYSVFFCVAELWGAIVISVLSWTLANELCTVSEAKTVYPLVGIAANFALVLAGNVMKYVNRGVAKGNPLLSLRLLVGATAVMTGVMLVTKTLVDATIPRPAPKQKGPVKPRKKKSGSLRESLQVLRQSPMIGNLAMLVVSYGVSHRLFDFAWKGQLRSVFPTASDYQGVLADVSIATGYVTIALMLGGRFVFQWFGWQVAAATTPVLMLLSGGAFFALSMIGNAGGGTVLGMSPAAAGASAGAVTQVVARSAKFSLFDPAKEMVYIEMSKEEKQAGKAAVDLVGSQVGKTGGAWITQALLLGMGSLTAALPIISASFVAVVGGWIAAVVSMGRQMEEHDKAEKQGKDEQVKLTAREAQEAARTIATAAFDILAVPLAAVPLLRANGKAGPGRGTWEPSRWPGGVTDAFGDDDRDVPENGTAPSSPSASQTSANSEPEHASASQHGFFPPNTASPASNGAQEASHLQHPHHAGADPAAGSSDQPSSPQQSGSQQVPDRWQGRQRASDR